MKIFSLSSVRPSAVSLLGIYLVIYSIPNILGFSSTTAPQLFIAWQAISLVVLLTYAFVVSRYEKSFNIYFLLFIFLLGFSKLAIFLVDPSYSGINRLYDEFVPVILAFVFLCLLGLTRADETKIKYIFYIFLSFVVFASIYNLILNFGNLLDFAKITDSYELIFQSFLENRNAFSLLVAIAIAILILMNDMKNITGIKFAILLAFLILTIFLTLSRGGVLFAALFSLLFFVLNGRIKRIMSFVVFALITILVFTSMVGVSFLSDNLLRLEAGSTHRDSIQEYGVEYYRQHNLLVGSGETIREDLRSEFGFTSLHSTYIDTIVSGGIIRSALYVILLVISFSAARYVYKKRKNLGAFSIAILITYLVYSLIETALPFGLSPTSAAVTVCVFLIPIYAKNFLVDRDYASKGVSNK